MDPLGPVIKQWRMASDHDRLDRVFEELNAAGIIAIHNASFDMTNGIAAIESERRYRRDLNQISRGFCFYHSQDIERAREDGTLHLAWGAFEGTDAATILAELMAALDRHGLEAKSPGS